ncbi:MAG TPA: ABC transporter permease [Acidimicrobiales bacterium]|nr:ABC transporter permease [Acidimicrobiales bacterium]
MLTITLQDLRFRARQFLIAIGGAGLVFSMTLLLAGLAAGFGVEIDQTVSGMGADSWVVAAGAAGRVTDLPPIPTATAAPVVLAAGVKRASGVVVASQAAQVGTKTVSVVLIGYPPGQLGIPPIASGRAVTGPGQVVVDSGIPAAVGRTIAISGQPFRVVGTVTGRTLLGGVGDVYVSLSDAQRIVFGGRPLVSAVLTEGVARHVPPGLAVLSNQQVEQASLAQMAQAKSSISNSRTFMWFIAAVIVAALVYVSALERTRDFAVLKALGSSSSVLFFGLAAQAIAVALVAAALAAVIANFMTGLFAQPVDIPSSAYVTLPLSALVVGLLASLVALRRAVSVDPAMAFAG